MPAHADPAHFVEAGHVSKGWFLTVDAEVAYSRILEPDFYKRIAKYVHLHDTITVRDVAGTFWSWLLVVSADPGRNHIHVVELLKKTLTPVETEPFVSNDMIARYEGPIKQWVVRPGCRTTWFGRTGQRSERSEVSNDGGHSGEERHEAHGTQARASRRC